MKNGTAIDLADQAKREGVQRPAAIGPAQGEEGTHVARGDRGRDQRVGRPTWQLWRSATPARTSSSTTTPGPARTRRARPCAGEMRAGGEHVVLAQLRRQGIQVTGVKKVSSRRRQEDHREGHHDLHAPARGDDEARACRCCRPSTSSAAATRNPSVGKLLLDIKTDVETGSSLSQAFRKYPAYFDNLFCNLVGAGEAAGILDTPARPPRDLQGEDPRHQGQDQGRALLSRSR